MKIMKKRIHIRTYGRVQGVCFRYYTVEEARRHSLTGWVKNCRDGSVEITAEGEENNLFRLLEWVKSGGPPSATVKNTDYTYSDSKDEFASFTVKY